MVSYHLSALLERLRPADIQADGGVKFQRASTCCRLRIPEHDTYLLTELVDKNHDTVRLTDHRSELSKCLGH